MIHYFLLTSYTKKKIWIIHLAIFLYLSLLLYLFIDLGTIYDRYLYQESFLDHQRAIISPIFLYLMMFILLLATLDHDERFHALIYPYINRISIDIYKFISYVITYTYLIMMMIFITELCFYIYLDSQMLSISFWLRLYLDGFICLIFYLIIIKNKQKSVNLILPLNFIVIHLFVSDQKIITLYYLFPIFHEIYDTYSLAIIYKLWYICFWFMLYLIVSIKRKIPA